MLVSSGRRYPADRSPVERLLPSAGKIEPVGVFASSAGMDAFRLSMSLPRRQKRSSTGTVQTPMPTQVLAKASACSMAPNGAVPRRTSCRHRPGCLGGRRADQQVPRSSDHRAPRLHERRISLWRFHGRGRWPALLEEREEGLPIRHQHLHRPVVEGGALAQELDKPLVEERGDSLTAVVTAQRTPAGGPMAA